MGKSLTDVAKAILSEGAYPSVSPDQNGTFDRDAKTTTTAKSSLRPGAGYADGRFSNPGATPPNAPNNGVEDLGPALVNNTDTPPSAKAAAKIGKDNSKSARSAVAAEKPKKQAEIMEEDVELDEQEQLDEISKDLAARTAKAAMKDMKGQGRNDGGPTAWERGYNKRRQKLASKAIDKLSGAARVPANEEYELDEEIELSEELEAFIMEMIEEGYSEEQIAEAIDENFELVSEETEELAEEEYQVDMSEHVEALFAGEDLSEEFKEKAKTIFEAAVRQKVEEEIAMLEEAYAETLEEQVAEIQEELSSNVDDYLNYVVEQWVGENEIAIEAGLRSELTEEFISGLRQLFAEHYIDIPEEKVSVVEEMAAKVTELEEKLNEEIERNVVLNKMLNESTQEVILADACDGLTVTQAEKLKALAEGIDFTSADEYSQKINILRESYFNSSAIKTDNVLDNNDIGDGKGMISEQLDGPMAAYVKTLGRAAKSK